jgi:hypothetical protein
MRKILFKGQVAETITWIVATVVIIVILSATLSINGLSGETKEILKLDKKIEVDKKVDLLMTKSFMSYLLTNDGGGRIFDQLKDVETELYAPEKIVFINKKLLSKIFLNLYEEDFSREYILLRIIAEECIENTACKNNRNLLDIGGLPSNKLERNKFFYEIIELKDRGAVERNTFLEIMRN